MANLSSLFAPRTREPGPPAPEPSPGSGTAAFAAYNRHRRQRLEQQAGERAAEALDLLPLLLHVNQPGLPGYVDEDQCPVGIADYSPSHGELNLARRLFSDAAPRRSGILRPVVDLIAVMGSVGTIGFSGESDLDVWVCHAPRPATDGGLRLFRRKVEGVEAWMNDHAGVEVHLFLQDTSRVRQNDFGQADLEGCGSAMGALLKEEFYRTGILLAGKVPFWWLTPAGATPETYQAQLRSWQGESPSTAGGYADLGWLPRVPLGELFGAAIWQIVKSWKSPFKSALKIGLLEKQVRSGAEVRPLCEILKEQVLGGATPDPYRLLFDEVLAYYRSEGDAEAEDLLARCFYLKAGARLDPDLLGRPSEAQGDDAVLLEYVRSWGWGARRLNHLNSFGDWRFEWVHALAKELDRFFLRTYQRIRAALDESGETQRITPRDLTILGRKLQTVYRRVPYKVETLHWGGRGVAESTLSLYQETLPTGESPWMLFRGHVNAFNLEDSGASLLRSSSDPLELLVWAVQNRLLTARTRLTAKGVERGISAADLEGLAHMLVTQVAERERAPLRLDGLLERARPTRLLVVANLTSTEEAVRELGALWDTTWGETFYRRWEGTDAFRGFIEELLLPFVLEANDPGKIQVFAPARKVGVRGPQWRLQREIPAIAEFLGEPLADGTRRRYTGGAAAGFYVLERSAAANGYKEFRDREGLLRYLSGVGPQRRVQTRVESCTGDLALVKAVVEASQEGLIDLFLLSEPDRETIFIVDEIGNLIHFTHAPEGEPYVLSKLLHFLAGVLPEVAAQADSPLVSANVAEAVRIQTLAHEGTCRVFNTTTEQFSRVRALALKPTGLAIERLPARVGQAGGYAITWGDQTIRSGEVANPLEELRRRIRDSRRSGLEYDVFLTKIFLDERFVAAHCGPFVATGHYLFYKKAIEQRLAS